MSNPTDLRVIKTRQAIRIALISLLSEKELSDITISELSARAQVNRKTFYRHYRSISDVVTEFENELLSDFSDILKTSNTSIFNIGSVLGEISALISSNQEYFVKLLKLNPELFSTGRVKAMLRRAKIVRYCPKIISIFLFYIFYLAVNHFRISCETFNVSL